MEEPRDSAPHRVEAYLDTVLSSLPRRLSAFERDELRRELRTHLWERVAAYKELGQTEDAAVTEALTQFGGGQDFLKQWRQEWTKTPHRITAHEVWEATRPMLRPCGLGLTAAFLPCVLLQGYCHYHGIREIPLVTLTGITWTWFWFALLLMPTLTGIRQAKRAPKHAGMGLLTALAGQTLAAEMLYTLIARVLPIGFYWDNLVGLLFTAMLTWIPIACGAAAVSGWWARRTEGRQAA